jgi:hypothetical protein
VEASSRAGSHVTALFSFATFYGNIATLQASFLAACTALTVAGAAIAMPRPPAWCQRSRAAGTPPMQPASY